MEDRFWDTLWLCQNSELENGPVEIVDFPIKNGGFSIAMLVITRGYLHVTNLWSTRLPGLSSACISQDSSVAWNKAACDFFDELKSPQSQAPSTLRHLRSFNFVVFQSFFLEVRRVAYHSLVKPLWIHWIQTCPTQPVPRPSKYQATSN